MCTSPCSTENRLKQVKRSSNMDNQRLQSSNGHSSVFQLPHTQPYESDGEDSSYAALQQHEEEISVTATETTCLLYDAHQQQKEHERMLRRDEVEDSSLPSSKQQAKTFLLPSDISISPKNSPGLNSRRSSVDSSTEGQAATSIQPIIGAAPTTPDQTVSSRIHFSDSVRISGGIKSKSKRSSSDTKTRRRISASSVFSVPPNAYTLNDANGHDGPVPSSSSLVIVDQSPPPPPTVLPSSCASSLGARTPRGSFSLSTSGRVSRAASFLSEDGTATGRSRASTPASIYAPLLLPSKTAPSPSRHFYLTFTRDNGQATYRELVRRQEARNKKRTKRGERGRGRMRKRNPYKGCGDDDELEGHEDDDSASDGSDDEMQFGHGWFCGSTLLTCGLDRVYRRWRRSRRDIYVGINATQEENIEHGRLASDSSFQSQTDHRLTSDQSVHGERSPLLQENKSEMEVLFGKKPWRYLNMGYWRYRIQSWRRRDGDEIHEGDEEW